MERQRKCNREVCNIAITSRLNKGRMRELERESAAEKYVALRGRIDFNNEGRGQGVGKQQRMKSTEVLNPRRS